MPVLQRRFHDPRIAVCPVIAATGDQADAVAVAVQPEPVGVVLDLVESVGPFKSRQKSLGPSGLFGAADLIAQGA
jgi:hypothetical protein